MKKTAKKLSCRIKVEGLKCQDPSFDIDIYDRRIQRKQSDLRRQC